MNLSRRQFGGVLGAGILYPFLPGFVKHYPRPFRVRTITAGVRLDDATPLEEVGIAIAFLKLARTRFEAREYEVQTVRIATPPLADYLPDWRRQPAFDALEALDRLVASEGAVCSIGPVITDDSQDQAFASWAAELVGRTREISFSARVASPAAGVHRGTVRAAAEAMHAIASATEGGEGNFRFAATAYCPPGTPFFPAAFFTQGRTFSIGLESPRLIQQAFEGPDDLDEAKRRLASLLGASLRPVEELAREIAAETGWGYTGMDVSPAPGLDASIGQAIETLTGEPFGAASTLTACAAVTDVLKGLAVQKCGYSGLMLPVLEDTVLARRAIEGRYGVSDLLLYSSVCGTGLDVVPLPGATSPDALRRIIEDVASLAVKYGKPLSARLFPVPGKEVGEKVHFDNPHLTDAVVMEVP
jgi:uncharacterized protein (UPF0210 family)